MKYAPSPEFVILSGEDKNIAVSALLQDGRTEASEALRQTTPGREIDSRTIHYIAESVQKLTGNGDGNADRFMAGYQQLKFER